MTLIKAKHKFLALVTSILAIMPCAGHAEYDLNVSSSVASVSKEIYDLHILALGVIACVATMVFILMIWSIINYQKPKDVMSSKFRQSNKKETIWTIIPMLILLLFAAPATKTLYDQWVTETKRQTPEAASRVDQH